MTTDIIIASCAQRSPAWFDARRGRLTGSCAATAASKGNTKSKLGPSGEPETEGRRDLRAKLALERLTGRSLEPTFQSAAMRLGIEREPLARAAFERATRQPVYQVGFLAHASLMTGASLDGYLGDFDELVSIKCYGWAEHMDCLRSGADYMPGTSELKQMLHELWLTGATAHHYVSFNPDFASLGRALWFKRFTVNNLLMELGQYQKAAEQFLRDVDAEVVALQALAVA